MVEVSSSIFLPSNEKSGKRKVKIMGKKVPWKRSGIFLPGTALSSVKTSINLNEETGKQMQCSVLSGHCSCRISPEN